MVGGPVGLEFHQSETVTGSLPCVRLRGGNVSCVTHVRLPSCGGGNADPVVEFAQCGSIARARCAQSVSLASGPAARAVPPAVARARLTVASVVEETEAERLLFTELVRRGIHVLVESNRNPY